MPSQRVVLAVDDDLQALRELERGLIRHGFQVLTAMAAEEALQRNAEHRPVRAGG